MKRIKRVPVALAAVAAVGLAGWLLLPKQPVANDLSGLYYKNWLGVYIYIPRDCGWLGCIGPDLRLVKYDRIPWTDPGSFEIVQSPDFHAGGTTGQVLAKDKRHVYYGGRLVPSGDPRTLTPRRGFAVDKRHVYVNYFVFSSLNPDTFEYLGFHFGKDKTGIYVLRTIPPKRANLVDTETFVILPRENVHSKAPFAEDANFLYSNDGDAVYVQAVKTSSSAFQWLGCRYAKYYGRVYYQLFEVEGTDPDSFRVLTPHDNENPEICHGSPYAIDKNGPYLEERRMDPAAGWGKQRLAEVERLVRDAQSKR